MQIDLHFLSFLSAIDLGRVACVSKSLSTMISSNDRLYQDLYEKYFNKISINFFGNNAEEREYISYKILFKRVWTMKCSSCKISVSYSLVNNHVILPYQCSECNHVNCGDCKCTCRYCSICNEQFEGEKSSDRTVKISNVYQSYELPYVIKCDSCSKYVHTKCHLGEAKCFRYRKCPGCMTRVCDECSSKVANHCEVCSNNFKTRIVGKDRYFLSNGNYYISCYIHNKSCCKFHVNEDEL